MRERQTWSLVNFKKAVKIFLELQITNEESEGFVIEWYIKADELGKVTGDQKSKESCSNRY